MESRQLAELLISATDDLDLEEDESLARAYDVIREARVNVGLTSADILTWDPGEEKVSAWLDELASEFGKIPAADLLADLKALAQRAGLALARVQLRPDLPYSVESEAAHVAARLEAYINRGKTHWGLLALVDGFDRLKLAGTLQSQTLEQIALNLESAEGRE